jgi:hypothetical protein
VNTITGTEETMHFISTSSRRAAAEIKNFAYPKLRDI